MQGFIKDYRQEIKSDIWKMPPLYHRTWQWLKYNVNHEDTEIPMRDGTRMMIKKGQRLTSVRDIAKEIGWYEGYKWKEPNPKTVSTILDWMEAQNMISIERGKGNRQYTLISLVHWEIYQSKEIKGNSLVTAREQCADINKNVKNLYTTTTAEILEQSQKETMAASEEYESVNGVYTKVFGMLIMNGMISDYIRQLKSKGYQDVFIIELMLETGESGSKPSLRLMQTIGERWMKEGIYSRLEAKQRKQQKKPNAPNQTSPEEYKPDPKILELYKEVNRM